MNDTRVTLDDVRSLGYCSRGLRAFFIDHGLDWVEFKATGVPVEAIEAIDDDMARRAAKRARERAAEGGAA